MPRKKQESDNKKNVKTKKITAQKTTLRKKSASTKKKKEVKPKIRIKHVVSSNAHHKKNDDVVDLKKNFSDLYEDNIDDDIDEDDSNFDWGDLLEGDDEEEDVKKKKEKKHSGLHLFKKKDKPVSKKPKHKIKKKEDEEEDDDEGFVVQKGDKKKKKLVKKISHDLGDLPTADLKKGFPMRVYKKMAVGFVLLAIILIAVIFYFSFVKATITVVLKQDKINNNLTFNVYERSKDYVIPDNAVRGVVKEIKVEKSKIFEVTGTEVIGEEVTGTVTIVNNYNRNQPLVATTRLLTPGGKLFRLKRSVNVPAGKSVRAEVYADKPNKDMLVGKEHFTIPGLWEGLQDKIYAESEVGDITYKKKRKKILQQSDVDSALKSLQQDLIQETKVDIENTYDQYNQKLYKIDEDKIDYKVNKKIGEKTERFSVSMKAVVDFVAFTDTQVYSFVKNGIMKSISDNKQLLGLDLNTFKYAIADFDLERKIANINVQFSAQTVLKPNAKVVDKNKIMNMNKDDVANYLSSLKDVQSFDIKIIPSFIHKTPSLVDRIVVKVK